MNCIYCQLGPSGRTTIRRRDFVPAKAVLAEIRTAFAADKRIEAITFSGSGEPTLHAGLGRIIRAVKRETSAPVVVLTNSSTLVRPEVRAALAAADIVVPSLDAATEAVFRRVNRPNPRLRAAKTIDGLAAFRRGFNGQIWLEILLVKGVNDGPAHLRALRRAIGLIKPDRVQLNTVVRPPAERRARPLSRTELERVKKFFGRKAEIIAGPPEKEKTAAAVADLGPLILDVVRRRPETADGIARSLGVSVVEVRRASQSLESEGLLKTVAHAARRYYEEKKNAARKHFRS
jgi:wyosine [tRNA(Phe)-imidazoG37] synthetase (radical SAM superfamily)